MQSAGVRIRADDVVQVVHGGRRVLDGVSVAVEPGLLVAVIGSSGAGKTLLLEALAGVRRPSAGTVRYDAGQGECRTDDVRVGFVPQDDIVHLELPLAAMLRYAARLRLPARAGADELEARVDGVLVALGLADQAAVRVGSLSGGERKRASIGVELLTRPRAFFLDEPTSGLDPLTAAVSDAAQATLALPMLCFPQVLFVGAILPVPLMAPVGRWLSYAMSNRWSFEALGHTAGIAVLWQPGSSPLGPPLLASYGDSFARPVWQNWCLLAGFAVLFLIGSWSVLTFRCRADRRG